MNRVGIVELQVAVDLVGGDVVQPHAVSSYRFQDGERPDHVGAQGQLRVVQRVVHVGFGGEMHHRVGLGDQLGNQLGVGDVALHQPDGIGDVGERLAPAGVGHGVEHRDRVVGVLAYGAVHEIGADEPGATGDQQPHGQRPLAEVLAE